MLRSVAQKSSSNKLTAPPRRLSLRIGKRWVRLTRPFLAPTLSAWFLEHQQASKPRCLEAMCSLAPEGRYLPRL